MPTARPDQSSADFCRQMGWKKGHFITGSDDGYGAVTVRLTAIGEENVLGKTVRPRREGVGEQIWSLHWRDWVATSEDGRPLISI